MLKKNSRKSWLLGLSAAVLLIAICGLYFRKAQFSATELVRTRISATNGFEELTALQVNGITQWLLARTRNANAPILLKLHGGPCSASMPFARTIDEPYLDTFIVVHWDQRACGKSFNLLHPFVSASISDRVADLDIVVGYLIEKYKRRNLILIAESYGTMFGPQYVAAHPEKIAAYIGIGQVYDEIATEQVRYNYLKAAAISRNDSESVAALGRLTFPHGVSDLIILNNELYKCRCGLFRHPHGGAFAVFSYDLGHLFKSPEYSFLARIMHEK